MKFTSAILLIVFELLPAHAATSPVGLNPTFVLDRRLFLETHNPGKKTVCTMTINSDSEKNSFLNALGTEKFDFVELVPQNPAGDPVVADQSKWFDEACASEIKCDLLVISGHFGGTFFGSSGQKLSLQNLTEKSCSRSCDGLIGNPKEVFLFGCNTLAGKALDERTPEEYRQVLIADGFDTEQANLVVEARYGAFSSDNRTTMQRVFSKVPKVYGFSSIAPTGEHVKSMLDVYLKGVGDYSSHLDQISKSQVNAPNAALLSALQNTAIFEVNESLTDTPEDKLFRKICLLYNDHISVDQKVRIVRELLAGQNTLSLLPDIARLIEKYANDSQIKGLKNELKNNQYLKNLVVKSIRSIHAPSLLIPYLKMGSVFSWLSTDEVKQLTHEFVLKPLFALPLKQENIDLYCSFQFNEFDNINYNWTDVSGTDLMTSRHFADKEAYYFLSCFSDLGKNNQAVLRKISLNFLANWESLPKPVLRNSLRFATGENYGSLGGNSELDKILSDIVSKTSDFHTLVYIYENWHKYRLQDPHPYEARLIALLPEDFARFRDDDIQGLTSLFFRYAFYIQGPGLVPPQLKRKGIAYLGYLKSHPDLHVGASGFLTETLEKLFRH